MQSMVTWVLAVNAAVLVLVAANFAGTVAAAIHCANRKNFEGKTLWIMIVIFLPLAGWVSYWFTTQGGNGSPGRTEVPPPLPEQTGFDVARAVAADLDEHIRQRRAHR